MKIGDKLYCKETLRVKHSIYFIKDKIYYINDILDFNVYVKTEEKGLTGRFSLTTENNDNFKFKNYFNTENDYRKQKLKKLNEKWG